MCLGILTTISKIMAANKIEAKTNDVKQNTCDATVKALTEQLKQKRGFNVSTGANFVDTKTPKLLAKLIPYVKSSENISENVKKELFAAMTNSEYFKPSPKHNDSELDKLIQESLLSMQVMEHIQQMQDDMLEFQHQQQMNDQQFQQQQFEQMNNMF